MSHVHPSWLDEFYGHDLSFDALEILTIAKIGPKLTKNESELYKTKWFDYRRMHPMSATYYMAHCYNKAYSMFMALAVDHGLRFMKGFKGEDFLNHREGKSFWKLRCKIDSLGIPYGFFLNHAMRYCFKRLWKKPPRPSQILHDAEMIEHVVGKWAEECAVHLQFPKDPWFNASSFEGSEHQVEAMRFIANLILSRSVKKYSLAASLYNDSMTIEFALDRFGYETVRQAVEVGESFHL